MNQANQKYEKYLPIGSVVLLKGATKKVMISGFAIKSESDEQNRIFDYVGCLYPEGVITSNENIVFNHDKIDRIIAIGYSDDEEKRFKQVLKEKLANISNKQ